MRYLTVKNVKIKYLGVRFILGEEAVVSQQETLAVFLEDNRRQIRGLWVPG